MLHLVVAWLSYHQLCTKFTLKVRVLGFGKTLDEMVEIVRIGTFQFLVVPFSLFISAINWLLPHFTSKMKHILLWQDHILNSLICFWDVDATIQVDKCVSVSMITNTGVAHLSVPWHRDLSEWNMVHMSKWHFETTGPPFKLVPEIVAEMRGSKHTLHAAVSSNAEQLIIVHARLEYL